MLGSNDVCEEPQGLCIWWAFAELANELVMRPPHVVVEMLEEV
jgi:hypothetical protein